MTEPTQGERNKALRKAEGILQRWLRDPCYDDYNDTLAVRRVKIAQLYTLIRVALGRSRGIGE